MFQPRYIKQAKLLQRGVRKFLRYKYDVLPNEKIEEIEELRDAFAKTVKTRDREKIEKASRKLTSVCERSVVHHKESSLRENLEVIFVAFVIAIGIRTYFLQPFKIPTGSMHPTLNGFMGYAEKDLTREGRKFKEPGILGKTIDFFAKGRTYVNLVAKEDDVLQHVQEYTRLKFFVWTRVVCRNRTYNLHVPVRKLVEDLGLLENLGFSSRGVPPPDHRLNLPIEKGQVLARGFVESGDQVLVDKVSYNFRNPRRGEVFVFKTKGIRGIEDRSDFNPAFGSQFYIKRLGGVPGDRLEIRQPELYVNGERAKEFGFRRVMDGKGAYDGYHYQARMGSIPNPVNSCTLPEGKYFALGDNSGHSYDSRGWGYITETNLVGPAFVVYWPFAQHWGKIR